MKPFSEDQRATMIAMAAEGVRYDDIGHEVGVSGDSVAAFLMRARAAGADVPPARQSRSRPRVTDDDVDRAAVMLAAGHSLADAAKDIGKNPQSIGARLRARGIDTSGGQRPWTAEEDAILRMRYPQYGCGDLVVDLGRTRAAVYQRARTLGLRSARIAQIANHLNWRPPSLRRMCAEHECGAVIVMVKPGDVVTVSSERPVTVYQCDDVRVAFGPPEATK